MTVETPALTTLAEGLRFPEGPVVMPDGTIALVEIAAGRVTRIAQDGTKSTISAQGGGPNGLALGPDGYLYCCNNGGFLWHEETGHIRPVGQPPDYSGGRLEKIEPRTGAVQVLYVHIGWLRKRIEEDAQRPQYVKTVRGVGYKVVAPGEPA